ncbi:MAG: helix-turn-helix transcriptional regulator [Bacteroidaceae bacterium]|nr:helix-turn-helix transcriptional regulator [Bacteroidaceae bacterium]
MLRIVEILREKNMSNTELAKKMKVSPQYVSDVVNERRNITLDTITKFATALGVPIVTLFDGYKQPVQNESSFFSCPHCGKSILATKA